MVHLSIPVVQFKLVHRRRPAQVIVHQGLWRTKFLCGARATNNNNENWIPDPRIPLRMKLLYHDQIVIEVQKEEEKITDHLAKRILFFSSSTAALQIDKLSKVQLQPINDII